METKCMMIVKNLRFTIRILHWDFYKKNCY